LLALEVDECQFYGYATPLQELGERGMQQLIGRAGLRFKGWPPNRHGHAPSARPGYASGMTDPAAVLLCYCTCPDAASAQAIAEALVGERLAACVNRLPGMHSTYRWQGAVSQDREELLLIKTTAARFDALRTRLLELHPYELPELVAVPVARGHAAYLDWVRAATGEAPQDC